MDFKLELVLIPVADVDRAKAFYASRRASRSTSTTARATTSASSSSRRRARRARSRSASASRRPSPARRRGLHLVVTDIEAARAELTGRGVEVSEIRHMTPEGWQPGVDPSARDYGSFADFNDPDGNVWVLQEVRRATRDRDALDRARVRGAGRARTAASCTSTATACSRRSTRPRTRCRRRCCARGAAARTFAGGPLFRAWLYRIATNVCLDALRRRSRRLDGAAARSPRCRGCSRTRTSCSTRSRRRGDEPDAVVVERETISLAFLAALQLLPPRQRAALIARDVLGWPAEETAAILETSRRRPRTARCSGRARRCRSTCPSGAPSGRPASRAPRSATCSRASSTRTSAATPRPRSRSPRSDIRVTMPPYPMCFDGLDAARAADRARVRPRARRRLAPPAHARRTACPPPRATCAGRATRISAPFKLDVLRVEHGAIAEITTFGPAPFPALGLPETLD